MSDNQRQPKPNDPKPNRGGENPTLAGGQKEEKPEKGPAQTPPTKISDQWRLEKIFSAPANILRKPLAITELLRDCIFVFDTSALLTPYESDKATIEEIGRVLKELATEKRLFVPQRALREFANNRGSKITEAAAKLFELRQQTIDIAPIPFLGNLRTADAVKAERDKLDKQIDAYREALDNVIDEIRALNYDDPVSALYRDLFPPDRILQSQKARQDLEDDFKRRCEFAIPPGYEDKHIGDLVIWHSILDYGERAGVNTVFISNDIKEDWAHKVGQGELGRMVAPRYELIAEYAERTNGKHYTQLQFAEFLKYRKANPEVVQAVEDSQRAALAVIDSGVDVSRIERRAIRAWRLSGEFDHVRAAVDREVPKFNVARSRLLMIGNIIENQLGRGIKREMLKALIDRIDRELGQWAETYKANSEHQNHLVRNEILGSIKLAQQLSLQ